MSLGDGEEAHRAILHAMTREFLEEAPFDRESFSIDEVAGLISGTLFESELRPIENRVLSDGDLEGRVRRLHQDHEAGVLPMLTRRRTTARKVVPAPTPLFRRQSPYWVAFFVFLIVGSLPFSLEFCSSTNVIPLDNAGLVVDVQGAPRLNDEKGEPSLWRGSLVAAEQRIRFSKNDAIVVADGRGERQRWDAQGASLDRVATTIWSETVTMVRKNRLERRRVLSQPPQEASDEDITILEPRSMALAARPEFRWSRASGPSGFVLRVFDPQDRLVFQERVRGSEARYPDSRAALEPGQTYRAELADATKREVLTTIEFQIASAMIATQFANFERSLVDSGVDRNALFLVEWHLAHGLFGEALLRLAAIRRDGPRNIEVLQDVRWAARASGRWALEARVGELVRKLRN